MKDEITVDELKIFVGAGLKISDVRNGYQFELYGVSAGEFAILTPLIDRVTMQQIGSIFKPIVHPLPEITIEHLNHLGLHTAMGSFGRNVEDYEKFVLEGNESLPRSLYLASKHYDIFNWLNRTGEDGQPLAVEKE